MAVVSDDHADETLNVEQCLQQESSPTIRWFSPEEVNDHNQEQRNGDDILSYWACIDGFVVDATDFIQKHPGGRKKMLSTNDAATGDTGRPFAFSFSRGRNAHFPGTARIFKDGISQFLSGTSNEIFFPETYRGGSKLVVLGKLRMTTYYGSSY